MPGRWSCPPLTDTQKRGSTLRTGAADPAVPSLTLLSRMLANLLTPPLIVRTVVTAGRLVDLFDKHKHLSTHQVCHLMLTPDSLVKALALAIFFLLVVVWQQR